MCDTIPPMAIAGSLVGKKAVPESLGTFPTDGTLFVVLLIGVVIGWILGSRAARGSCSFRWARRWPASTP